MTFSKKGEINAKLMKPYAGQLSLYGGLVIILSGIQIFRYKITTPLKKCQK
jgi:hypothetical protein